MRPLGKIKCTPNINGIVKIGIQSNAFIRSFCELAVRGLSVNELVGVSFADTFVIFEMPVSLSVLVSVSTRPKALPLGMFTVIELQDAVSHPSGSWLSLMSYVYPVNKISDIEYVVTELETLMFPREFVQIPAASVVKQFPDPPNVQSPNIFTPSTGLWSSS